MKTSPYNYTSLLGIALALLAFSATAFSQAVTKPPVLTTPDSLPAPVDMEAAFSFTITVNPAADAKPSAFGAAALPPGLAVDTATGKITGRITRAGVYTAQCLASNAMGQAMKALRIVARAPLKGKVLNERELFITDAAVLNPPTPSPAVTALLKNWSMRSVLARMAPPGADVNAFAEAWFKTWEGAIPATPRPAVAAALRSAWAADRFRLIAAVNRLDLSRFQIDLGSGKPDINKPRGLGEGRLIYEVLNAQNQPLRFTIIFEFGLGGPGNTANNLLDWSLRWHALGRDSLQGAANLDKYRAELNTLIMDYTFGNKDVFMGRLNQIRTNELVGTPWQLREFHLNADGTRLDYAPVLLTPANALKGSAALNAYVSRNKSEILAGRFPLPLDPAVPDALTTEVPGAPPPPFKWNEGPLANREGFIFSFNTCNGCHAANTGTVFQHIGVSNGSSGSRLSKFLSGNITLEDQLPGAPDKQHNEMAERAALLLRMALDVPNPGPVPFINIAAQPLMLGLPKKQADEFTELLEARMARVH